MQVNKKTLLSTRLLKTYQRHTESLFEIRTSKTGRGANIQLASDSQILRDKMYAIRTLPKSQRPHDKRARQTLGHGGRSNYYILLFYRLWLLKSFNNDRNGVFPEVLLLYSVFQLKIILEVSIKYLSKEFFSILFKHIKFSGT